MTGFRPGTTPWWRGLPPTEIEVSCLGSRHRIQWRDGGLVPLEHDDPEGESLLIALGAPAHGCHELLAGWRAHSGDARVLTLGPRSAHDRVEVDPREVDLLEEQLSAVSGVRGRRPPAAAASRPGTAGKAPLRSVRSLVLLAGVLAADDADLRSQVELLRLFTLPRPMLDRLVLEVSASLAADLRSAVEEREAGPPAGERHAAGAATGPGGHPRVRGGPALVAGAIARVRAAVLVWSASRRADPSRVEVVLASGGADLDVVSPGEREVRVAAGCDWLSAIWARQMSVVDGHLVTGLVSVEDERVVARALPADAPAGAPPREVEMVRRPGANAWAIVAG